MNPLDSKSRLELERLVRSTVTSESLHALALQALLKRDRPITHPDSTYLPLLYATRCHPSSQTS